MASRDLQELLAKYGIPDYVLLFLTECEFLGYHSFPLTGLVRMLALTMLVVVILLFGPF